MNLKVLITDDDAVSPVIGVILMVAITVILAAVIGTFVLGIGQDQQTVPSTTFDFEVTSGPPGAPAYVKNVTAKHTGGSKITDENTGQSGSGVASCAGQDENGLTIAGGHDTKCWRTPISAGNRSPLLFAESGGTVEVIWEAPGGGDSQILADHDIP